MAIGKFGAIFSKLSEELEEIKSKQSYNNLSLAFSHWFLKNQYNLSEQEVAESIIDGNGDYGVDAVIHNDINKTLEIFQFKFPSSAKTISDEIKQADVHKLINGFNYLIDGSGKTKLENASPEFIRIHDELKEKEVYSFKVNFVSFNQGVIANKEVIDNFITLQEQQTGIQIEFLDYNVRQVTNIYEKLKRQNSVSITLPYKLLQSSYSVDETDSFIGFVSAKDLLESIKDIIGVIFDENIRLHEMRSKVNEGIKATSSSQESGMFYFYNNGITLICDDISNSPSALKAKLEGVSIVNGCQTVTSLYETFTNGQLNEDVCLLVRVIKISDYDSRAKITQYLNSQTPIKDSYFISNHTIVRDLQTKLLEYNYFLERQVNESTYKEKYLGDKIKEGNKIIKLENAIQYYSGYYLDKFAAAAKRSKNSLFSEDNVSEILSDITAERVIEAYETYEKVSEVITSYRRYRRNKENQEFSALMKCSNEELSDREDDYLFINTADILLLNTCKLYKEYDSSKDITENVISAIKLIINIIAEDEELKNMPPAGLTKNQRIFMKVKENFHN